MRGTAMPRGCEKKRNLTGSAVECPGMRDGTGYAL